MLTGIGGQGIQLAAQVLARAATLEGRHVMYLGTYGGTMRGGSTDSVVVVADRPIVAPPIVSKIGSALAMHHAFWGPIDAKLRPDALLVVNSGVFEGAASREQVTRVDVAATELATGIGNPLAGSMVLLAAYVSMTGILRLESLIEAMRESIPSYRQQHIEANEQALRLGHRSVTPGALPRPRGAGWQDSARAGAAAGVAEPAGEAAT